MIASRGKGSASATLIHGRAWLVRWLPQTERQRLAYEMAALALLAIASLAAALTIGRRMPHGDILIYHHDAWFFWNVPPRFSRLPSEYPPAALLIFSLTLLPPVSSYQAVFIGWMCVMVAVGYLAYRRFAGQTQALVYAGAVLLGTGTLVLLRFDLAPALLTVGALWAAQRRRYPLAYTLLGLGILLKLYPVFLMPPVFIDQWRHEAGTGAVANARAGRTGNVLAALPRPLVGVALAAIIVTLGFGGAVLLNPDAAFSSLQYFGTRPLQVESTPATFMWLGSLVGIPARADFSYATFNLVGPADEALKLASTVALAGGCFWIYAQAARGKLLLGTAFAACLAVVIVTGKVFSPQYLIWILPVLAATDAADADWPLWLAICFFTIIDFPFLYNRQIGRNIGAEGYSLPFLLVVAARNALLLVATLRLILRPEAETRRPVTNSNTAAAGPLPLADRKEPTASRWA
jgi:hypothetical protein